MTTASGTRYELSADGDQVRRLRGLDSPPLRRDDDWLPVLAASTPAVGQPWQLLLDVRGDGIPTLRTTNQVTAIEP